MPYTQTVADGIQLKLLDEDDYPIGNIDVDVHEHEGILRIQWSEHQTPLTTNTDYRWLLQIDCHNLTQHSDSFTTDLVVEGFIHRLDERIIQAGQSNERSPLARAEHLATSGIWNDALNALVTQSSEGVESETIITAIQQLLASVGLEEFTEHFAL